MLKDTKTLEKKEAGARPTKKKGSSFPEFASEMKVA